MKNNETSFSKNKKIRNDVILAAVIITIAAVCLLMLHITRESGNNVIVKVNGEEIAAFSLTEEVEYEIRTGENKESINILVVENGKAYISYADCPDGICKQYRPVSFVGETIVCLPHKVVVEIAGNESDSGLDIAA